MKENEHTKPDWDRWIEFTCGGEKASEVWEQSIFKPLAKKRNNY